MSICLTPSSPRARPRQIQHVYNQNYHRVDILDTCFLQVLDAVVAEHEGMKIVVTKIKELMESGMLPKVRFDGTQKTVQ